MAKVYVRMFTQDGVEHKYSKDIISVQCSENSKDSELSPSPGLIEQHASIKLYDRDDYFKDTILKNTTDFFSGAEVYIYIEAKRPGTVCGSTTICNNITICNEAVTTELKLLGNYYVDRIDMEGDDDIVSISCVDQTIILSKIKIHQYPLATRYIDDLLKIVFNEYLSNTPFKYIDNNTKYRCEHSRILNNFITDTNARDFLEQVCTVGLLNIYYSNGYYCIVDCYQGDSVNVPKTLVDTLILKPSQYNHGLKWDLNIKNQIDTINLISFSNDTEAVAIGTKIVSNFEHKLLNRMSAFSLPAKSTISGGERFDEDETWAMLGKGDTSYYQNGPYRCSKGYAAVFMGHAEFDVTVPEPIAGISATISYKGTTTYTVDFEWGDFGNPDEGGFHFSDIVSLVDSHTPTTTSEWTNASNYVDYANAFVQGININPYVKKVYPATDEETFSPASDIITKWTGTNHLGNYWWSSAEYDNWRGSRWDDVASKRGGEPAKESMWPNRFYDAVFPYFGLSHSEQRIKGLRKGRRKIELNITKTDDYHYHVALTVPTFYAYIAYTEENYAQLYVIVPVEKGWVKFDALAFYDMITEVSVAFSGFKYASIENEYSYSLDGTHITTDNPKNNSIFKVPNCRLITEQTIINALKIYSGEHVWREYASSIILNNYKDGRYVVNVDVNAEWCIDNNISVNKCMCIKLPDNKLISRKKDISGLEYTILLDGTVYNKRGFRYLANEHPYHYLSDVTLIIGPQGNQTVQLLNSIDGVLTLMNTYEYIRKITMSFTGVILYTLNEEGEYTEVETLDWHQILPEAYAIEGLAIQIDDNVTIEGDEEQVNHIFNNGAYVIHHDSTVISKPIMFQVKNITKKFEKEQHVYQLQLIEEKLEDPTLTIEEIVVDIPLLNVEYYIGRPIDFTPGPYAPTPYIGILETTGFGIIFRRRWTHNITDGHGHIIVRKFDVKEEFYCKRVRLWLPDQNHPSGRVAAEGGPGGESYSDDYSLEDYITVELVELPKVSYADTNRYSYFLQAIKGYIKEE